MALQMRDMIWVEQCVTNEKKSTGAAYLLWFFLWWCSAHRFYLGRPVSAVLQIISYFFVIGFLWALLDLILIPGMVDSHKHKLRREIVEELHAARRPRRPRYDPYEDYDRDYDRRYARRYAR